MQNWTDVRDQTSSWRAVSSAVVWQWSAMSTWRWMADPFQMSAAETEGAVADIDTLMHCRCRWCSALQLGRPAKYEQLRTILRKYFINAEDAICYALHGDDVCCLLYFVSLLLSFAFSFISCWNVNCCQGCVLILNTCLLASSQNWFFSVLRLLLPVSIFIVNFVFVFLVYFSQIWMVLDSLVALMCYQKIIYWSHVYCPQSKYTSCRHQGISAIKLISPFP